MPALLTTRSGKALSRIGLGTWGLGGVYYGEVTFEQGVETVRAYLDAGGNHLDSAYSYHQAEDIVGAAIKHYPREDLFLTSKTYAGSFPERNDHDQIAVQCDISLRDLGTDYLDCYMVHGTPDRCDDLNRALDAFDRLKATGKVLRVGCSIRGPSVTDQTRDTARMAIETGRIDVIQLNYSVARQKHAEVFAAALKQGVAVITRWVLESGFLAGKYPLGQTFTWPDTRNRYQPAERDRLLQIGLDLKTLLPEGFDSPVALAVAFALASPAVTGVILGSNTAEQTRRNVALSKLPPLPLETVNLLKERYFGVNDACNPTGAFEHVDSPRRPLGEP